MWTDGPLVITGASGALGQVVVREALAAGADVAAVIHSASSAPAAAPGRGRLVVVEGVDLSDAGQAERAMRRAAEELGGIGGLINAVGGFAWKKVEASEERDWDGLMAMNFKTVLNASRAALPWLRQRNGRIVNVGARGALDAHAGMAPYAASKSAVHRLTEAMARELKGEVAVNAVLPTTIDTPDNRAAMPDADTSAWLDPRDIAAACLFLASARSRAINGALVPLG